MVPAFGVIFSGWSSVFSSSHEPLCCRVMVRAVRSPLMSLMFRVTGCDCLDVFTTFTTTSPVGLSKTAEAKSPS